MVGCAENHVTDLANRSVAARSSCRVIAHLADFGNAVGNGHGKSDLPQQWQIRNVIADVNTFGFVYTKGVTDAVEGLHLVGTAQSDMSNTELLHANLDCTRFATTDDSNLNAGLEHFSDSKTVQCAKGLAFDACIREVDSAIGEYAINVESNQPNC